MLLELRYQTLCNVIYTPVECVGKLLLILCIICVPCTCVCACMHVCVCVCACMCEVYFQIFIVVEYCSKN